MQDFVAYHKDHAPNGKLFDANMSKEVLTNDGWVDSPSKFGHDVTGQADKSVVADAQRKFESGSEVAFEDRDSAAMMQQRKQAEIDALREEIDNLKSKSPQSMTMDDMMQLSNDEMTSHLENVKRENDLAEQKWADAINAANKKGIKVEGQEEGEGEGEGEGAKGEETTPEQ